MADLSQAGYGIDLGGNAPAQTWDNSLAGMGISNAIPGDAPYAPANSSSYVNQSPFQMVGTALSQTWDGLSLSDFATNLFSGGSLGATNSQIAQNLAAKSMGMPAPNQSSNASLWSDLFLRSVIIILGFIFVAAGLTMFKNNK